MTLVPSVLEHDGLALRDLGADEAELVLELAGREVNLGIFEAEMPASSVPGFLASQADRLWGRPMACLRAGRPVGVLLNPLTNANSLNTLVAVLLEDPERDRLALPLYVRHLFWSFPVHRVYAEVPGFAAAHRSIFSWAGFEHEGTLPEHLQAAGGLHDLCLYGQLRQDFDSWAARELPPLSLPHPR